MKEMNVEIRKVLSALCIIALVLAVVGLIFSASGSGEGGIIPKPDGKQVMVSVTLEKPGVWGNVYIKSYWVDVGKPCYTFLSFKPGLFKAKGDLKVKVDGTEVMRDYNIDYFPTTGQATYDFNMKCVPSGRHDSYIKVYAPDGSVLDTETFSVWVADEV